MPHSNAIKLSPDEKIISIVHRHWFILFGQTFGLIIVFFAPIVLYIFAVGQTVYVLQTEITLFLPSSLAIFIFSMWGLLIWMQLFNSWTDHYLDGWIVTNKRIMDIEQRGFFSRQISSFRIERIQDVTTDIHGFIATLLDFGDVHVQTASESHEFVIKGAPNPKAIKELILRESDRAMEDEDQTVGLTETSP